MNPAFLFKESLKALRSSPVRTLLTMLGVIIGVAAVIAMMSIGGGARQETVRQIESLGATNIYVRSSRLTGEALEHAKKALSSGLNRKDMEVIASKVPWLSGITFEMNYQGGLRYKKSEPKANLIGVGPDYFDLVPAQVRFGSLFAKIHYEQAAKVVILSSKVAYELFGHRNAVNQYVKIAGNSFRIIGVLQAPRKSKSAQKKSEIKIGERDRARDVYFPWTVIPARFPLYMNDTNDSENDPTYSELSMLIVKLKSAKDMKVARDFIQNILERRHRGVNDYQIIAPIDLLEKSNKIQEIFNLVMIFIASLSLIVGGIGIMNIMLANIQQRVKEIGIRRAIGATKQDILYQFLLESVVISFGGGILGVLAGVSTSYLISQFTGWTTVISVSAILVSFGVSVTVGLVFGIFPAHKASDMDPITALRYE